MAERAIGYTTNNVEAPLMQIGWESPAGISILSFFSSLLSLLYSSYPAPSFPHSTSTSSSSPSYHSFSPAFFASSLTIVLISSTGSMYSTANDMAKFVSFFFRDDVPYPLLFSSLILLFSFSYLLLSFSSPFLLFSFSSLSLSLSLSLSFSLSLLFSSLLLFFSFSFILGRYMAQPDQILDAVSIREWRTPRYSNIINT